MNTAHKKSDLHIYQPWTTHVRWFHAKNQLELGNPFSARDRWRVKGLPRKIIILRVILNYNERPVVTRVKLNNWSTYNLKKKHCKLHLKRSFWGMSCSQKSQFAHQDSDGEELRRVSQEAHRLAHDLVKYRIGKASPPPSRTATILRKLSDKLVKTWQLSNYKKQEKNIQIQNKRGGLCISFKYYNFLTLHYWY